MTLTPEETKQLCPLMLLAGYNAGFNPDSDNNLCKEERCAWWFGAHSCCSFPAIANSLERMEDR